MIQTKKIISAPPLPPPAEAGEDDAPDTGDEAELRTCAVTPGLHGERLDRALAALVPEFSRSYLRQLLDAGLVRLGGAATSCNIAVDVLGYLR